MNYDEFKSKVKESLEEYFGDTAEVRVKSVMKNNGVTRYGVTIFCNRCNLSPTIYLEEFYNRVQNGEVYAQIIHEIITIFEEHKVTGNFDISFFTDFDNVKDRIMYKLVNAELNSELLKSVPHIRYMDFAIVFFYLFSKDLSEEVFRKKDTSGTASILIYNSHMAFWKKSIDDLKRCAEINTARNLGVALLRMEDVLLECMAKRRMEDYEAVNLFEENEPEPVNLLDGNFAQFDFPPMYVLTNDRREFGASAILYDGILKRAGEIINSGFYIIPSSIHELILVPEVQGVNSGDLKNMVKQVNDNELPPAEVLSDSVYYYNPLVGELSVC